MESKIHTRSQSSSIICQGIQYRQAKRPVGERLSSDFLELKEMFRNFVRDYENTAGVDDVAKKGGQWLQDVEETINHHVDDYLTKLVRFNDVNEPILSWSDVGLAEDLLRSQYRDLCGFVCLYKAWSDAFRQCGLFCGEYPMRVPVNSSLSPDTYIHIYTHTGRVSRFTIKRIHTILVQKQALFLIQLSYSVTLNSYTKIELLT